MECSKYTGCGGITYSTVVLSGLKVATGPNWGWGWQLRAGTETKIFTNKEFAYLKTAKAYKIFDQATITKTYDGPYYWEYSPGCPDGTCTDYATLEEAISACNAKTTCNGITWAPKAAGGGATGPVGGSGY